MMEGIRNVGFTVCIVLLITGIFSMLIPAAGMEKTIKTVLGVFFLASLVVPFVNSDFKFEISSDYNEYFYEQSELAQSFNSKTKNLTEQYIAIRLKKLLGEEGYETNKITVSININDDNSIDIIELYVELPKEYMQKEDKIKAAIRDEIGFDDITFKY